MGYSTLKYSGLTSKGLLDKVRSLLTGDNECIYDGMRIEDIKNAIDFKRPIFNNEYLKNMIKQNNSDFIILGIVENYSSVVRTCCYQKLRSRNWYEVVSNGEYLRSFDGLTNILKHIDRVITNSDRTEGDKLYT